MNTRKPAAFKPSDKGIVIDEDRGDEPFDVAEMVAEADAGLPEALEPHARVVLSGARTPGRRGWRWGALFAAAASALLSLAIGLGVAELIEGLYARHEWLGHAGLALLGAAMLAALAVIVRELVALVRLRRLEHIHLAAERALRHHEAGGARTVVEELRKLYDGRADMAWALSRLAEHDRDVLDPDNRVALTERILMADLDAASRTLIARTARKVSVITAVNPAPVLDVAVVAALNLSMIRRLAALYGVRPGTLGTLRLARMVITHLAVSGGLAIGDTVIQHIIGRGLAGRLSAKIGEGTVNGIMAARIGIAALDLCRPVPFHALPRPRLKSVLAGVFERGKNASDGEDGS
jgi:putative membrane protein